MRKSMQDKTVYQPNQSVKITVNNKPVIDDDTGEIYMYEIAVTVKLQKYNSPKPLRFRNDAELIAYMENVDFSSDTQDDGVEVARAE